MPPASWTGVRIFTSVHSDADRSHPASAGWERIRACWVGQLCGLMKAPACSIARVQASQKTTCSSTGAVWQSRQTWLEHRPHRIWAPSESQSVRRASLMQPSGHRGGISSIKITPEPDCTYVPCLLILPNMVCTVTHSATLEGDGAPMATLSTMGRLHTPKEAMTMALLPTAATVMSPEELRRRRAELLASTYLDEATLDVMAAEFMLTPQQRSAWETIRSIDFLLGDD